MSPSIRSVFVVAVLPVIAGCCCPGAREDGFESLFNGRDLDGWETVNGAKFSVRDGFLFVDRGTGWLRSKDEYGDFVLRFDVRLLEEGANSGIFVRTGATSKDDENGWPDNGYQVQCFDDLDGERPIASMIPYGGPDFTDEHHEFDREAIRRAYRGVGEWNSYEIVCSGADLSVKLNGAVVSRAWNIKNRTGHVGIQAEHGRLEFRNLRLKHQ